MVTSSRRTRKSCLDCEHAVRHLLQSVFAPERRQLAAAAERHVALVSHVHCGIQERQKAALQCGIMNDRFASLRDATTGALLQGAGTVPDGIRQAIAAGSPPADLMNLVQKIRSRAYTVTDQDLDALRSRFNEDQLFEIIVSAAFGTALDQPKAVHRVLEDA